MATASRAASKTANDGAPEAAPAAIAAPTEDDMWTEIAKRAYARYCDRGCAHGGDLEDWVAAEKEVLAERGSQA
jgi:hypothetical protein